MITLNDINHIVVGSSCQERYPCGHSSTITLKDGRSASELNSFQICSIVSNLANERINPNGEWAAERVKHHFKVYNQTIIEMGWVAEPPEAVLNSIFPAKQTVKPAHLSFDLEDMLSKAKDFSKNDNDMFKYISDILNDDVFQNNPQKYMDDWRKRRGYTEECRYPEDHARIFFSMNFKCS